jgi:hypothetical protein
MKHSPRISLSPSKALLDDPSREMKKLIQEYVALSIKETPSEKEGDHLQSILQQAEEDEKLALWIVVADSVVSQRLGLLDPEHYEDYERQHEKLKICLTEHTNAPLYEAQEEIFLTYTTEVSIDRSPRIYPAHLEHILTLESGQTNGNKAR